MNSFISIHLLKAVLYHISLPLILNALSMGCHGFSLISLLLFPAQIFVFPFFPGFSCFVFDSVKKLLKFKIDWFLIRNVRSRFYFVIFGRECVPPMVRPQTRSFAC